MEAASMPLIAVIIALTVMMDLTSLTAVHTQFTQYCITALIRHVSFMQHFKKYADCVSMLNWASFWRQLDRNFLITANVYVDQTLCTVLIN